MRAGEALWRVRAWYVRPTTNARVQLRRTSRDSAPSLSQIVRVPHGAAVGELPIIHGSAVPTAKGVMRHCGLARTAAAAADGRARVRVQKEKTGGV